MNEVDKQRIQWQQELTQRLRDLIIEPAKSIEELMKDYPDKDNMSPNLLIDIVAALNDLSPKEQLVLMRLHGTIKRVFPSEQYIDSDEE